MGNASNWPGSVPDSPYAGCPTRWAVSRVTRPFESTIRGKMTPKGSVLVALAKALGVSVDFLMSDNVRALSEVEFRKRQSTSAKDRARVEAEVMDQVDRYMTVEEILELDAAHWIPPIPAARLAGEADAEMVAERVRDARDLGRRSNS